METGVKITSAPEVFALFRNVVKSELFVGKESVMTVPPAALKILAK